MNKKGFTLVELLAVIALIAIISTIAFSSAIAIRNNSNKKLLKTKVEQIESAAILYGQENPNILTTECIVDEVSYKFCKEITVKDLIDGNFFEPGVFKDEEKVLINDVTSESMNSEVVIIYRKNNRIYAIIKDEKYKEL